MKKLGFVFILVFSIPSLIFCQESNYKQIEKTLNYYMEGSSYNKLEMLESAFAENATLYLTLKEGFKVITPEEYVAFFKKREHGKFNGRYSELLAVEVVKDIATAKVKIDIPDRNMVYIDLFLLKEFEKGWKIISKTATRIDEGSKSK